MGVELQREEQLGKYDNKCSQLEIGRITRIQSRASRFMGKREKN